MTHFLWTTVMELSLDHVDHENEDWIGQFGSLERGQGRNMPLESHGCQCRVCRASELEGRHAWP